MSSEKAGPIRRYGMCNYFMFLAKNFICNLNTCFRVSGLTKPRFWANSCQSGLPDSGASKIPMLLAQILGE